MKRRGFFSALIGASTATASVKYAAPPVLRMRIPLGECVCGYCPMHEGDFFDKDGTTFAVCLNRECSQYGIAIIPFADVEVKQRDRAVVDRIRHEHHMTRIEKYRRAWTARLDAGHAGPIKSFEEGQRYGDCYIREGKMKLVYG